MTKKKIFQLCLSAGIASILVSAYALAFSSLDKKNIFERNQAEEKMLVEDFTAPQFTAGVLHTEDAYSYIDLTCSSATLNGNSLVMANASSAEAAVKGVTKIKVAFSGNLSVSIATVADKYYVTEQLSTGIAYEFPYSANFLKLEASLESTITRIEYSYVCEVGETYLTNFKTTSLTTSSTTEVTGQCYNYWTENSGVKTSISNNSSNLSVSFTVKASKSVYENESAYFGGNKEIYFQTWFYVYDTTTSSNAGSFYLNIFKWSTTYVVRLLQGSTQLINYRAGALCPNIFTAIGTANGADFVLDFTGGSVQLFYNNAGTYTSLGTSTSNLSWFNGNNAGTQQIRYCDFKFRAGGDAEEITGSLANFQVAYGYHKGTGKLVKA